MLAPARTRLLVLGLSLCLPCVPHAQAVKDPIEEAGRLYQEGVKLFKDGAFPQAAEKFQAAYNLDPSPILLYNLARAAEEMGDASGAIGHYRAYLVRFPEAEDKAEVERRIRILDAVLRNARMGTLRIAGLPPGAGVTLNDQPAPEAQEGGGWRLDPQTYTVRVQAADGSVWAREVDVVTGETATLTYQATPVAPPDDEQGGVSGTAIAGWSAVGAGAVALGLGGFFYSRTFAARDDFESFTRSLPADVTAQDIIDERDAADDKISSNGTLAYVMWGVGAAAVATGVVLLVLDRDNGSQATGSAALVPLPGGLGLTGTF